MIPVETIRRKYGSDIALVLLCCRVYFKTETASNLQQFIDTNEIDWKHLLNLAAYHRIEPIIFKVLTDMKLPDSMLFTVKQKRHFLIQQSFRQTLEAERIICELRNNGIQCMPYKGVSFSRQFYGDIVSRESSDIDLVISPKDFEKARQLMLKSNYKFENKHEYEYFGEDIFVRQKGLNFNRFNDEIREFHIEFHWRITENLLRVKKSINSLLFSEGNDQILAKERVKFIHADAHYTAVFVHHSNNDGFSIFRNLIDLNQPFLHSTCTLDANYIQSVFTENNLQKAATICSLLSKELLGVNFPVSFPHFERISDSKKKFFLDLLLDRKMIGEHFRLKFLNKNVLLLKDTAKDQLNYVIACLQTRFIPSAKDFRVFNLPKKLYFLYFVLKPFRSLFNRSNVDEEKEIVRHQK